MRNVRIILILGALLLLMVLAGAAYKTLAPKFEAPDPVQTDSGDESAVAAPDFTVYDAQGKEVRLSDFKGKPVIVNFWATWCGPCQSEMPAFEDAWKEYGDEVVFLMVNLTDGQQETVEGVKKFIADAGYEFPVYFDSAMDAAMTYGVYSIPATVAVKPDGNVLTARIGALSESVLTSILKDLLK